MDEWADKDGNTLSSDNPASFQYSMEQAFYNPLGELTVPVEQRNFATKENLPTYPEKIKALKKEGARLVTVYGWLYVSYCFLGAYVLEQNLSQMKNG